MDTRTGWSRFAQVGMALAFGFMAGSLEALTRDAQGMRFKLGFGTVVAFLIGAAIGWFYWQMAMKLSTEEVSVRARRRFILVSVLLFLAGFGSYIYRIRFVSTGSSLEVVEGVLMAFAVVGVIALVMWRIGRFLEGK